jgi:hypothetical protein
MLNAKRCSLLLKFVVSCCQKSQKRIKDEIGCCLVTEDRGVAIWETALKDFLQRNGTTSPNELRILLKKGVDGLLNALNCLDKRRRFVQRVF